MGVGSIVTFDKHRGFFGDDAKAFEAALDPLSGLWTVKEASASRDAEIHEMNKHGFNGRQIAHKLGVNPSTVSRALKRMNGSVHADD
jgi:DNA-binding NarL/FixJ family response regulator